MTLLTGAALPFSAFIRTLTDTNQWEKYQGLVRQLPATEEHDLSRLLDKIRDLIEAIDDIPDGLWHEFIEAQDDWFAKSEEGIFVRTSTNAEGLPQAPGLGAGMYKTVPHLVWGMGAQQRLWDAIKTCWASLWSEAAYRERQAYGVDQTQVYPAVWFVPSQPADYAFCIHTSNLSTENPHQLVIEVVQGAGESLVSNDPMFAGFPTRIVWDKQTKQVVTTTPGTKQRKVVLAEAGGALVESTDSTREFLHHLDSERLIRALAAIGEQAEAFFDGQPQEIEGVLTVDPAGDGQWTIALVQTTAIGDSSHIAPLPGAVPRDELAPVQGPADDAS